MRKISFIVIFFLVSISIIVVAIVAILLDRDNYNITSFESCLNAGFSIIEETPRKCITNDGSIFLEVPIITDNAFEVSLGNYKLDQAKINTIYFSDLKKRYLTPFFTDTFF